MHVIGPVSIAPRVLLQLCGRPDAVGRHPLVLVRRRKGDLPQFRAIDADLEDAKTDRLRRLVVEDDPLAIKRQVIAIDDPVAHGRRHFGHRAVSHRQREQSAAELARTRDELVVVMIRVVSITLDKQQPLVGQQRIEGDQGLAREVAQLGQQVRPLLGREIAGNQPLAEAGAPLEQGGAGIVVWERDCQRLDRRA